MIAVTGILLAEVAVIDLFYGVGTRFGGHPIYAVVFFAVVLAAAALIGRVKGYLVGAALSVIGFCVAMVIAANVWGT